MKLCLSLLPADSDDEISMYDPNDISVVDEDKTTEELEVDAAISTGLNKKRRKRKESPVRKMTTKSKRSKTGVPNTVIIKLRRGEGEKLLLKFGYIG